MVRTTKSYTVFFTFAALGLWLPIADTMNWMQRIIRDGFPCGEWEPECFQME